MSRLFRATLALLAITIVSILPAAAADKLNVVATVSIIADMVSNVAGDHVDLVTIVGPDGDTEVYEPSAGDVPKVANARILFMNGLNDEFEPWVEPLMKQARFSGTKVVVSRGVKALSAEDEHPMGGKPKASVLDQHAWMDPRNAIIYVKNIADALARADPTNAEVYRDGAAAYTRELRTLDTWAHAEMAAVPPAKRRVLASHDSLQYLAYAFGITMISVNGWTNKSEPSAADLARLTDQIGRERVKALFLDSITDPRAMERISQETGAVIGGADRLNPQAANAFLKTLEEPPANSILILLSTEPSRILETILSRCLRLNCFGNGRRTLDSAEAQWLEKFGALAAGEQKSMLGRYRLLDVLLQKLAEIRAGVDEKLTANSPLEKYEDLESDLRDKWEDELTAAIEAEYRRRRTDLLRLVQSWLRDIWLHTLAAGETLLTFPDVRGAETVARRISSHQARENLQTLEQIQRLLNTNVQESLALEVGLLKLHF